MDKCHLCGSEKQDEIKYGEFITKFGLSVHLHCLYLSSELPQNGDEDEGIMCFLPTDIRKEAKRTKLLKCYLCGEKQANIKCCFKGCPRSFHLVCGIENGSVENRFSGKYISLCSLHSKKSFKRTPKNTDICCICFDNMLSEDEPKPNPITMLPSPCCSGWFHKWCLQGFANTAGYFFKCPLCNNSEKFCKKMQIVGIFIPNRDASWELEPGAYSELLIRPDTCCSEPCQNSRGPKYNTDHNPLMPCVMCGAVAIHKLCLNYGGKKVSSFTCNECKDLNNSDSGSRSINQVDAFCTSDTSSEIDVEEISEDEAVGSAADGFDEPIAVPQKRALFRRTIQSEDEASSSDRSRSSSTSSDILPTSFRTASKRRRIYSSSDSNPDTPMSPGDTPEHSKPNSRKNSDTSSDDSSGTYKRRSLRNLSHRRNSSSQSESDDSTPQRSKSQANDSDNTINLRNPTVISCTRLLSAFESNESLDTKADCRSESDSESDVDPLEDLETALRQDLKRSLRNRTENSREHVSLTQSSSKSHTDESNTGDIINISCIAQRTRTRRSLAASVVKTDLPTIDESDSEPEENECGTGSKHCNLAARQGIRNNSSNPNSQIGVLSPLDISCIANRTRKRKSLESIGRNSKSNIVDENRKNSCDDNNNYNKSKELRMLSYSTTSNTLKNFKNSYAMLLNGSSENSSSLPSHVSSSSTTYGAKSYSSNNDYQNSPQHDAQRLRLRNKCG